MKLYQPSAMTKNNVAFKAANMPVVDHSAAFNAIQDGLIAETQRNASIQVCDDLRREIAKRMAAVPGTPANFAAYYSISLLRSGGIPRGFPPVLPLLPSAAVALSAPSAGQASPSSTLHPLGPVTSLQHIAVSITPSTKLRDINVYVDHIDAELLKADDFPKRIANVASNLARLARLLSSVVRDHLSFNFGGSAGPFDTYLTRHMESGSSDFDESPPPPLAPLLKHAAAAAEGFVQPIEEHEKFAANMDLPPRPLPKGPIARFIFYGHELSDEQINNEPERIATVLRKLYRMMPPFTSLTPWRLWMASFVMDSIDLAGRLGDLFEWYCSAADQAQEIRDLPSLRILHRIDEVSRACRLLNRPTGGDAPICSVALGLAALCSKPSAQLASLLADCLTSEPGPFPDGLHLTVSKEFKSVPRSETVAWTRLVSELVEEWWKQRGSGRVGEEVGRWQYVALLMGSFPPTFTLTHDNRPFNAMEAALNSVKYGGTPDVVLSLILRRKLQDALNETAKEAIDECHRLTELPRLSLPGTALEHLTTSEALAHCFKDVKAKDHILMSLIGLLLATLDAQSWHGSLRWAALRRGGSLPENGIEISGSIDTLVETATVGNVTVTFRLLRSTHPQRPSRHVATIVDRTTRRGVCVSALEAYVASFLAQRTALTRSDAPHALFGLLVNGVLEDNARTDAERLFLATAASIRPFAAKGNPRVLKTSWDELLKACASVDAAWSAALQRSTTASPRDSP